MLRNLTVARRTAKSTNLLSLIESARLRLGRGNTAAQRGSFAIGSEALDNSTLTRSSIAAAINSETKPSNLLEIQAANSSALYDFIISNVEKTLSSAERQPNITPTLIKEAHRIGLRGVAPAAGQYRAAVAMVYGSDHASPPPEAVPQLVDNFCEYINSNWNDTSALHLAAYALWRLLWIHPFTDGNGRVARALSYLVLSAKLRAVLPGTPTLPALIAQSRDRYYSVLEAADRAQLVGAVDISPVEQFLAELLELQLTNAAVLPRNTEIGLDKAVNDRILHSSPEFRRLAYGTMDPTYHLWSHGAGLILQVCSYEEWLATTERQVSFGDPFPGLLSDREQATNYGLSRNVGVHFLRNIEIREETEGPLFLAPDVGLILSSSRVSAARNYPIVGTLYCIRFGPRTTIENCDELFDLMIARHIRVMS
jgi:Fic family protein